MGVEIYLLGLCDNYVLNPDVQRLLCEHSYYHILITHYDRIAECLHIDQQCELPDAAYTDCDRRCILHEHRPAAGVLRYKLH